MNKYPKKLQNIVDELSFFTDQNDRISLLIDYAEKYKPVPEEIAVKPYSEEHKVDYCESEAYVWVKRSDNGTIKLYFAVENPQGVSAKALAAILDEGLSGETAENILSVTTDVVFDIFGQKLSMGKNLGLTGILQLVQREVKKVV
ncbi:MAG: SufE family protein [Ignavibacteria bacterium]|jgi:cysteine desulfuration protein SufE